MAFPLHLLCCPTQGRSTTTKADWLICMLSRLKTTCAHEGLDLTTIPLPRASWFVSQSLRQRRPRGGCTKIILAGKSADTLTIHRKKQQASRWKQDLILHSPQGGIAMPSGRGQGHRPPFGALIVCFLQKSTTRSFYVMHLSQVAMRGAEIWHSWKQQHLIEWFWKLLKAICHIRSMPLHGDGWYAALLIKVFAYLLAIRLQAHRSFSQLTITQIMRKLSRTHDLRDLMMTHFHDAFSITEGF
jgi:hypothetical protein